MAKHIDQNEARKAALKGLQVGQTEPSRETKGTWWEVYLFDGRLIACVLDPSLGVVCGEEITETDIDLYCDNPVDAVASIAMASE